MFEVDVACDVYSKWKIHVDYLMDDTSISINDHYTRHSVVLKVSKGWYHPDIELLLGNMQRTFTFESEQHYHWFLLQQ